MPQPSVTWRGIKNQATDSDVILNKKKHKEKIDTQ